jgi:hypothetical protein
MLAMIARLNVSAQCGGAAANQGVEYASMVAGNVFQAASMPTNHVRQFQRGSG